MSVDVVSQLQEEVTALSTLYWNYTGILQRDAPAIPLAAEPLLAPRAPHAEGAGTTLAADEPQRMAHAVVEAARRIETLADALPQEAGDAVAAQTARLAVLQVRRTTGLRRVVSNAPAWPPTSGRGRGV
jgi:hypothetical protein